MNIPSSVYRIQVSKQFPIKKVTALIPYLHGLGVEGIYCSPLMDAFATGYDVANPNRFNPQLGGAADFESFFDTLQKFQMKHILDVVPNHMGIRGDRNLWWLDVLEKGAASPYADFFDINWMPEKLELQGKILLPILNDSYGKVLDKGDIKLIWKEGFWIQYADYRLPICLPSYAQILKAVPSSKEELALAMKGAQLESLQPILDDFNKKSDLLHTLLERQFYRLSYWIVAGQEINYRRFFNINELIAINIDKEKVLNEHHHLIFNLIQDKKVHGLRIDHPDGLYNPRVYLERIRKKKPGFVWVEKILDFGEKLNPSWKVDGTVGYDFLNIVSGLFVQKRNKQKMLDIYHDFIKKEFDFKEIHYAMRKKYITANMASEVNYLGMLLDGISERNRYYRDLTKLDLTRACLEILACFPVYRTYIEPSKEISFKDREYILQAVVEGKKRAPEIDSSVFEFIKRNLLLENAEGFDFVLRFQQLTAPVMAKGLEDSTFYIYNPLISLNEVGGNPHYFGYSKLEFHHFNEQKLKHWPLGALATSTHDSKFSEDARLRIHALSEMPKKWQAAVRSWQKLNAKYKTPVEGRLFPDPNTEYFLYQMLLALWPADTERLWVCLQKAMRQAGIYTSWRTIDEQVEAAVKQFLEKILKKTAFFLKFTRFQKDLSVIGFWNSLSALVLKIGSCGIADFYQGNETMTFSLMDPDNRRPIDFSKKDLKTEITQKALLFRKNQKDLFLYGDYIPLKSPENVIAFIRKREKNIAIVLAARFLGNQEIKGAIQLSEFGPLTNIFTNEKFKCPKKGIPFSSLFANYPFAILTNQGSH